MPSRKRKRAISAATEMRKMKYIKKIYTYIIYIIYILYCIDIGLEQVPAIGGASTDTLDDPSFTGHDVTPSLRQESSSEVLPDSLSQDLVSTPTAPPCESHPLAFFNPSQVLNDLTT